MTTDLVSSVVLPEFDKPNRNGVVFPKSIFAAQLIRCNMIKPITPSEAFRGQEEQIEKAIETINDMIAKAIRNLLNREKKFRLYISAIKHQGGRNISEIDIDTAMDRFKDVGWHIDKHVGVEVGRNEYDTIYNFCTRNSDLRGE